MAKTKTRPPSGATRRRDAAAARKRQATRLRVGASAAVALLLLVVILVVANRGGDDSSDATPSVGASTVAVTGGDFHSLVADPATPGRLFAGGHQSVSTSTDGGVTWQAIDQLRDADAMGWGITDTAIYVSGHPGLNRSTDDGQRFERINDGLPGTDVHAFGAGGGKLYGFATGVGVFSSDDDGATWTPRASLPEASFFGRIIVDRADNDHLVAADASSGPTESTDGGATWAPIGPRLAVTWMSGTADLRTIIASGPEGALRSDDGGTSWAELALPDGASLVELAPDGTTLYTGIHRAPNVDVQVSIDGGETWSAP